jgi:hypothetical protein
MFVSNMETRKKHVGDAKFGNDAFFSAPLRALREDIFNNS